MNWRLVTRPLNRASQLDLRGEPDSCGVWAPCLSHADGLFWLIYTDVKRYDGNFKDAHNYLVTAPAITGPWSDPIYMNSSGFDPSLFHDDDGRKWFVNQQWKHSTDSVGGRPRGTAFDGILCQEYDPVARRLTGPIRNIFAGSPLALVEGPHLFKRDGWYYLTTAEGGTGYDHAVTMARSRDLRGPYELHPQTHLLTSKDAPDAPLQRAGHGQIVETPDGAVYHTHLCTRPLPGTRRSPARPRDRDPEVRLEATTAGSTSSTAASSPPSRSPPRPAPASPSPTAPVEYRFDGPALPRRLPVAAHPLPRAPLHPDRRRPAPASAASPSAAGSSSRWSPAASSITPTAPRPASPPSRPTPTSRPPASRPTTTARSSTSSPSPTTPALGRVLTILSCPGDWPDGRLSFPLHPPIPLPDGPVDLAVEVTRRHASSSSGAPAANGSPPAPRSTPRSSPTRAAAASTAPSPAPSSACSPSTPPAAPRPADFASFSYAPPALTPHPLSARRCQAAPPCPTAAASSR